MSKRILIIDDDPVVATVYQRLLESEGFTTASASNGAQGLDRVLNFEPDAVLLDLLMPTLDGFIVLKTMRAVPTLCRLPVIVLTSACTFEFKEKALAAGANYVLDKSLADPAEIISLLQIAINGVPANRVAAFERDEIEADL